MANKSLITSIRLNEDDYQKLKVLKEEYDISWAEFIKYANRVLSEDKDKH